MKTPPHGSDIGEIVYHERDGLTDTECADEPCRPVLVYLYYYADSPPHGSAIDGIVYHKRDVLTDTERADKQCVRCW